MTIIAVDDNPADLQNIADIMENNYRDIYFSSFDDPLSALAAARPTAVIGGGAILKEG